MERREAIPLDKNEGIYVRDTQTGRVRAVIGETYMLKITAADSSSEWLTTALGVSRATVYRWFEAEGIDPAKLRALKQKHGERYRGNNVYQVANPSQYDFAAVK